MDPDCLSPFAVVARRSAPSWSIDVQVRLGCVYPKPRELLADKVLGNKTAKLL